MLQSPVAIKSASVIDRSYRFAARRQGRTLFIEGYVPDERTIEQLLAFARERFFNVARKRQMRTPSLHASPARCHDECKTPGAARRIAGTPRPGTALALRPARLVHRPRAMMRAARFELGSIERSVGLTRFVLAA